MAKIRDIQESADHGRVLVDEQLSELEARLTSMYSEVNDEMKKELNEYLDKYKAQDLQKQKDVENGKITQDQYENWKEKKILRTDRMRAQIEDLTQTLVHADEVAMTMIRDELPQVYATSYNFGVYRGETYANASGKDFTSFTIYNADAVRELAKNDPDLLPVNPRVDIPKDERWNRQHVQSAIAQGIIKGDPINKIADRLQTVTDMDRGAAIRNARTAVNGIENKGRKDATERLKEAGIAMVEVWSCTHDGRTRQSHVLLDYTTPDEQGYFGNGLQYPGDPDGPEEEVYNCRCSLLTFMEGIDHSKDDELYEKFMEENYFDEWEEAKEKQNLAEGYWSKNKQKAEKNRAKIERKWIESSKERNKKLEQSNKQENSTFPESKINDFKGEDTDLKSKARQIEKMTEDQVYQAFIPEDSYIYSDEYSQAEKTWNDATAEYRRDDKLLKTLEEQLREEATPKPKSEWTIEDEIEALIGRKPMIYTEKGEGILSRIDELKDELRTISGIRTEAADKMERISKREARREIEEWNKTRHPFKVANKEDNFTGFSTMMRSAYDADLAEGKGFIARMSPDEYLQRISYDIFETTVEHATVVEFSNVQQYAQMMADGVKMDMGYINYEVHGSGRFGQEGRHRAMAAKLLGIDEIPVYIRGVGRNGI